MDFVTNLIQNPYLGFTNASLILNNVSTSVLANIATSTNVPATSLLSFISNAALSGNAAQGLLYGLAENYYYNKWLQTVTYNAPSITFSTSATLSTNVLIAQEITVASGVTVTCGTHTCFFVAQVFNNQGTISCPYGAPGGPACPSSGGAGAGGTGGGGVVIITYTAAIGTISANGNVGGTAYYNTNSAFCFGANGVGGQLAVVSGISVPIGGNGAVTIEAGGAGEPNAGGGGGGHYGGGFGGGSATVYSFTNGNALITYAVQGISDWWLSNVVGKAPSTVTPLLYVYGSGGGSGGASAPGWGGAGGGGGGGEVIVFGDEVTAGTVSAVGGTGGYNPGNEGGGGGGGGGIVLAFYGAGGLNGTMSLDLAGGGTGVTASGYNGLAGQTGVYLATSITVNG